MSNSSSPNSLSQLLRRQLQELHIDPDIACARERSRRRRFYGWYTQHKEAALLVGVGTGALLLFCAIALVLSAGLSQSLSRTPAGAAPATTSVSLDDVTIQITAPAYHRLSAGEGVVTVSLMLRNPTSLPQQFRAGDLLLVDGRGALFPPTWHSTDGSSVDGLANPSHVFLALDPDAQQRIDLQFLVLTTGPFTLRYQRQDEHADAELPQIDIN